MLEVCLQRFLFSTSACKGNELVYNRFMGAGKGMARRAKSVRVSAQPLGVNSPDDVAVGTNSKDGVVVGVSDFAPRTVSLPVSADGGKIFSYRHPESGIETVITSLEEFYSGEWAPLEPGTIDFCGFLLHEKKKVGVWQRWINKETAADGNERLVAINSWLIIR